MYIGMNDDLVSIHRNVTTVGGTLSGDEMLFIREMIKTSKDEDFVPNSTFAGHTIKSVIVKHQAGSRTTNIVLEVNNEDDTETTI